MNKICATHRPETNQDHWQRVGKWHLFGEEHAIDEDVDVCRSVCMY